MYNLHKFMHTCLCGIPLEIHVCMYYTMLVRQRCKISYRKDEMNVTEALLKAILELIEKCDTLEELRESVKRIMNE